MMREIGVGELIRAWHELGASDLEAREAIRDLLLPSFTWIAEAPEPATTPAPKSDALRRTTPRDQSRRPEERREDPRAVPPPKDGGEGASFTVTPVELDERPLVVPVSGPKLAEDRLVAVDPEPLLEPVWTRHVIGGIIATEVPLGDLDVRHLVRSLVAMREVRHLPRRRKSTLRLGAQVLLDRHPSMMVFYSDQSALRHEIEAFGGRERTVALRCDGIPPTRVSEISAVRWRPYAPPLPGTPVLLVTDLGMARDELPTEAALDAFLAPLAAAGSPVLALVPCAPESYPAYVRERLRLLLWDMSTRPSDARRTRRARS